MIDSRTLLSKITTEQVIKLMSDHGSPVYSRTTDGGSGQECLWFRTICHGGDSHKLCYYTSTKTFYCYTSCGFMSFYDFVKKINHYDEQDFYSALKFVADLVGESLDKKTGHGFLGTENEYDVKRAGEVGNKNSTQLSARASFKDREAIKLADKSNELQVYNKYEYYNDYDFNTFYQGWIDEGITVESMKKFSIGWKWYGCYVVIPHLNINGDLIGVRKRTFNQEEIDYGGKYMPITTHGKMLQHELGKNLYGIYENKDIIKAKKEAVLVEGEKSVLLLDSYYGSYPAVATCGFNVSDAQMKLLASLHITDVYLAFDHDFDLSHKARDEYSKDEKLKINYNHYLKKLESVADKLANHFRNVYIILDGYDITPRTMLGDKDAPVDKGKAVFNKLYNNALSYKKLDKDKKGNKICKKFKDLYI